VTPGTLALVESPVQLLHALEWCHDAAAAPDTAIAVLAPRDPVSRRQLEAMAEFADEEGIETMWYEPRGHPAGLPGVLTSLGRRLAGSRRLLVGDPFSGLIQCLLPVSRAEDVVVLDDGTATIDFTERLASQRPLTRWVSRPSGPGGWLRTRLGRYAGSFLAGAPGRRVSSFTVMPGPRLPGLVRRPNSYEWTRRRFGTPRVVPGVDVVGTSLVESGVVDRAAYCEAVGAMARSAGGPGRYFAHRREADDKLADLAATGLEVVRPEVPLEVEMRRGPVAGTVISFPSSVCYTLPVVLGGLPVRLTVRPVEPAWLAADVPPDARRFLRTVEVRATPRLVASPLGALGVSAERRRA